MISRKLSLSVFCILLGNPHHCAAATLHSQVYQEGLWPSDRSATGAFRQYADLFSLVQDSSITQVTFWGTYVGDTSGGLPTDAFTLEFYEPVGGMLPVNPTVAIPLNNVTRIIFDVPSDIYQYTATISPEVLTAGQHGFSIYNDLTGFDPVWQIGESQDLSGTSFIRQNPSDSWGIGGGEHALVLEGAIIPEPSGGILVISSLMGGILRRRRKESLSSQTTES